MAVMAAGTVLYARIDNWSDSFAFFIQGG